MKNMLEGMVYMQQHNQVAGIVSSNICGGFGLEDLRSKGDTSPGVVENNQAKLPWDFQIQTDKVLMANQPDIVVADKQRRKVVIIDVAIHGDSKIREKEDKELKKYQGLRQDLEKRLRVTVAIVVPVVIRALWAGTPKLGERLQQISVMTSEISVLGTQRYCAHCRTVQKCYKEGTVVNKRKGHLISQD